MIILTIIGHSQEIFIEYFMKQGLEQARNENRRNVNYQDLGINNFKNMLMCSVKIK